MKAPVSQWFEEQRALRGIMAAAVRAADKTTTAKLWSKEFAKDAVENALRCVADIYQVLPLNGVFPARLRLVYRQAWLHCERGPDGSCLGVFSLPDPQGYDAAALEKRFKEFRILSGIKKT
jgi:hypothetical protein